MKTTKNKIKRGLLTITVILSISAIMGIIGCKQPVDPQCTCAPGTIILNNEPGCNTACETEKVAGIRLGSAYGNIPVIGEVTQARADTIMAGFDSIFSDAVGEFAHLIPSIKNNLKVIRITADNINNNIVKEAGVWVYNVGNEILDFHGAATTVRSALGNWAGNDDNFIALMKLPTPRDNMRFEQQWTCYDVSHAFFLVVLRT